MPEQRDFAERLGPAIGHNLPAAVSTFLGREAELEELTQLVAHERLVTLTGAPGMGKSRLAVELARTLVGEYRDGAWLVELAPVGDDAHVPAAVAAALSVTESPGEDLVRTLIARVQRRRLLIILDNCEHLVGACAQLVGAMLAGCPELSIVATSRQPLGVAGETVWQVPALGVPDERALPLDEYSAVRLFVERARAQEPGFELTAYVAPAVAQICLRLDGMPLAIELAAGRVGSLTPAEIAQRLDDRFGLLASGSHGVQPPRQTLQAALDWSYTTLSSAEAALLRRLAIFSGGFCGEAAAGVCGGGEVDREEVGHLLDRLLVKSLVSEIDRSVPVRYRLLETVRAYAGERLDETDEAAALREHHAAFYLDLAERAEPQLTGREQELWLDRLEAERQNLRAALEWTLSYGRGEWSLRLAGALVLFWRIRGQFSDGRRLLLAALSAGRGATPALEAKALWGAGFLAHMAGDTDGAVPLLEGSLQRFAATGDTAGRARALLVLGNCWQRYDHTRALALLEQSATLAREAGDRWCLAHALGIAGFGCSYCDDLAAARPLFEECLAVAREAGDKQGRRLGVLGLGCVALAEGDYAAAEPLLEEAVALADELREDYTKVAALQNLGQIALGRGQIERARGLLDAALDRARAAGLVDLVLALVARAEVARHQGDPVAARAMLAEAMAQGRAGAGPLGPALRSLGSLNAEQGDARGARRLLEEALELGRSEGDQRSTANALFGLAELAVGEGQPETAIALFCEALAVQCRVGDAPLIAEGLECVATLAADAGNELHAARLLGAADALRERGGYVRETPATQDARVQALRKAVGRTEFDAAWARGAELSTADAVALAARGPGRGERGASGWSSLTDREWEVAALVGDGLTNREIGERLFVSPWTVKTHLANIFAKLEMTRRSELAGEVSRRASEVARHAAG